VKNKDKFVTNTHKYKISKVRAMKNHQMCSAVVHTCLTRQVIRNLPYWAPQTQQTQSMVLFCNWVLNYLVIQYAILTCS